MEIDLSDLIWNTKFSHILYDAYAFFTEMFL